MESETNMEEGQQQARVLDGRALAADIRRELAAEVQEMQRQDPSFAPGLAILQVGGREDSNVYIRMKTKAANEVGRGEFQNISLVTESVLNFSFYRPSHVIPLSYHVTKL